MMFSGLMSRCTIPALCGQGAGRLDRDVESFAQAQSVALDALTKRFTFDELGGHELLSVDLAEFMNSQDVRMIECRRSLCFLLKASQAVFVSGVIGGQKFKRDSAIEQFVFRQ